MDKDSIGLKRKQEEELEKVASQFMELYFKTYGKPGNIKLVKPGSRRISAIPLPADDQFRTDSYYPFHQEPYANISQHRYQSIDNYEANSPSLGKRQRQEADIQGSRDGGSSQPSQYYNEIPRLFGTSGNASPLLPISIDDGGLRNQSREFNEIAIPDPLESLKLSRLDSMDVDSSGQFHLPPRKSSTQSLNESK